MALKKTQNIVDQLFQIMPQLQQYYIKAKKNYVDPDSAKKLFSIWRDSKNKVNSNTYQRPRTVSMVDVEKMQKEGLVRFIGDKIEITKKGGDVIKVMVLGDERSVFEDSGVIIDHEKSLANTKNPSMNKTSQKRSQYFEDSWWSEYLNGKDNSKI